jgi:hypothetical protein
MGKPKSTLDLLKELLGRDAIQARYDESSPTISGDESTGDPNELAIMVESDRPLSMEEAAKQALPQAMEKVITNMLAELEPGNIPVMTCTFMATSPTTLEGVPPGGQVNVVVHANTLCRGANPIHAASIMEICIGNLDDPRVRQSVMSNPQAFPNLAKFYALVGEVMPVPPIDANPLKPWNED